MPESVLSCYDYQTGRLCVSPLIFHGIATALAQHLFIVDELNCSNEELTELLTSLLRASFSELLDNSEEIANDLKPFVEETLSQYVKEGSLL